MCASLACQVWLNISSLARRRRHRRATVRSMRLPSVIVKKGKVVLVVVATWEQQNFLVKTPQYRKLRKYYRNNNIASIEKAYWENLVKSQRVAGNLEYNNWNWPWIFLVKLQCALYYYWLSTLCCCGFLKTEKEKKISWNHGATVKCCQLSKWSESSNSDAVKIINIDLFCQKT